MVGIVLEVIFRGKRMRRIRVPIQIGNSLVRFEYRGSWNFSIFRKRGDQVALLPLVFKTEFGFADGIRNCPFGSL